jgi:hypothetical protein
VRPHQITLGGGSPSLLGEEEKACSGRGSKLGEPSPKVRLSSFSLPSFSAIMLSVVAPRRDSCFIFLCI